ncbi:MAG TPA: MFS transporter [Candidatus Udaeobacter sp.]|nr:MFS transporter [Candidatus Udaeobacter sp.]
MILAAFRVRSFRFQWPADLLTSWAFEMETLILGWYVMVQTGSVLLLTLFGSAQFLGTLAAPMFGVLGDRVGGRLMLCAMRAIYATLAVTVMLLAFTGGLTPAWAIALAALNGIVRPNDLVMRNALIGETIPPDHLMGALGMSRATMDSARVGGALAGAGLSTMLGIGLTYVFVTCFYLASLALTFGVARARPVPDFAASSPYPLPLSGERDWGWGDLKNGVAHILSRPQLLAPMWLAFLINLTAYPASGVRVGVSYVIGAVVPILPVLFGARTLLPSLVVAGGVIVIVSTILAFLSGMNVKRRILLNLAIIAAAVAISYLIGLVAQSVWGITV